MIGIQSFSDNGECVLISTYAGKWEIYSYILCWLHSVKCWNNQHKIWNCFWSIPASWKLRYEYCGWPAERKRCMRYTKMMRDSGLLHYYNLLYCCPLLDKIWDYAGNHKTKAVFTSCHTYFHMFMWNEIGKVWLMSAHHHTAWKWSTRFNRFVLNLWYNKMQ